MRILPLRALVALSYTAGVLALTTLPGRQVARWGFSGSLLDLAHIPLFSGLTLVTLWAVVAPRGQRLALVVPAIVVFAIVDEQLQRLAPGRDASFADFLRDVLGVAIGVTLSEGLRVLSVAWKKESQS
jgi:VanZ family protein